MADEDRNKPSLELPSLGFGRRRGKKARAARAEPETEPIEDTAPEPEPEPTPAAPPLFADEVAHSAAPTPVKPTAPAPVLDPEPEPGVGERKEEKPRREFALPRIGGLPAAVITGALVGVLTVGLTWGGLRLCEVVKGTSSCGTPGFVLLVAILITLVLLGSLLLRAWGVPDPGSTSFLGVGLLAVVALLFLVDMLFNWWMIIVIPVLAILTFALSQWVSTAIAEQRE